MKSFNAFRIFSVLTLLALFSSCAMLSTVSDDDVYVLSTPTLENGEELNDESSYQNFKYQKERQHQDVRYGFNRSRGVMFMLGSPFSYHAGFPLYSGFYSVADHAHYSPFYNNYNGYMSYGYPSFYDYPGSLYYGNYPFGMGYGFYNNPYKFNNNANTSGTKHNNTIYKARNSSSGSNVSRRQANNNNFGGMAGMAKPTSTKSRSDYAHNGNYRAAERSGTNPSRTTRPVEKGVGLSRPGTRVTSVNYDRNTGSPAYQRSSNEARPNVGRSGTNSSRDHNPSVSPSKTNTTPSQGRRKN